jgi:hypothetical protein
MDAINNKLYTLVSDIREVIENAGITSLSVYDKLDELTHVVGQVNLVPLPTTLVICHKCKRIDAPMYFLRRSGGKYIPICYDNEGGCWKHETPYNCGWTDHMNVPCEQRAEWRIAYGKDKLSTVNVCVMHIGVMLADTEEHTITRLD